MWCVWAGHQPFVDHRLSCLAHNNYSAVKDLFEICIALSAPKGLAGIRSASYQQRQPWFKSFAAPPRHSKRQTFGKGPRTSGAQKISCKRLRNILRQMDEIALIFGFSCTISALFGQHYDIWQVMTLGLERWELPYNFLERRAASYSWLVVGGFWFASSLPPSFRTMHSTVCR